MKQILFLFLSLLLFSCTQEIKDNPSDVDKGVIIETIEQKIVHHIEANLQIPATEEYTYETYESHLDNDDSIDMVITVNLLDRAMKKAIAGNRLAKRAETGFSGRYNYFFIMDGASKEISVANPVSSSAKAKLTISFENIRTEAYKDIIIDYKLDNASFRRYLTIYDGILTETFEIMMYDGLGDMENHSIVTEYDQGSYSLAKDILIYSGELEKVKFDDPSKVYDFDPEIKKTDILERRWFYNDKQRKYFTKKD
mgnify:CR=1 FL=1|tara:strand:- start:6610 stop:7371 length:762 start_codon:yes stop_codon:yes gene_type:complete